VGPEAEELGAADGGEGFFLKKLNMAAFLECAFYETSAQALELLSACIAYGTRAGTPGPLRRGSVSSAAMSKAFTKESEDGDEEDEVPLAALPGGGKNYITPHGYKTLRDELLHLIDEERPKVVDVVHWAASNGDRSENGDYLYGKKRLREIDRRIRFLTRRLELAVITEPSLHHGNDQIFFGATVTYVDDRDEKRTITITGIDEADSAAGEVSWISPIARTLLKARVGDVLRLPMPGRVAEIEVLQVHYPAPGAAPQA
jgi:transcription elongation factor GreB